MELSLEVLEQPRTLEENIQIFKMGSILQGAALEQIKRLEQYKGRYGSGETWEKFCKEELQIDRRYADRQIDAFQTWKNLKNGSMDPVLPTSERQVRPIVQLPPEKQIEIWNKSVKKSDGKIPTAKVVQETVQEYLRPSKEAIVSVVINSARESLEKPMYLADKVGVSVYNPLTLKRDLDKFELLWNQITQECDEEWKRKFAKDLAHWIFNMYPGLINEFGS